MLTPPAQIFMEWRIWIVNGVVVTYSLYKEGTRVTYRHEIDKDALVFAQTLAGLNKGCSPAYVMDICRTQDGLRLLETNCINAADLAKLAETINGLGRQLFCATDCPQLLMAEGFRPSRSSTSAPLSTNGKCRRQPPSAPSPCTTADIALAAPAEPLRAL